MDINQTPLSPPASPQFKHVSERWIKSTATVDSLAAREIWTQLETVAQPCFTLDQLSIAIFLHFYSLTVPFYYYLLLYSLFSTFSFVSYIFEKLFFIVIQFVPSCLKPEMYYWKIVFFYYRLNHFNLHSALRHFWETNFYRKRRLLI